MTSKDKKDVPAAKAEPLKDADLDQVTGGVWGLESNFVKAPAGDASVAGSASPNGGIISPVAGSAQPNGGKSK